MPTYDYECEACGHTFERFQEITARKLRTCPQCGKRKLRRLIGRGMGLIFRGSGFYETDYKRAAARTSGERSSDAGSGSDASKGDSKSSTPAKTDTSKPKADSGGKA
jgi:putative FmdB family regulatory protein